MPSFYGSLATFMTDNEENTFLYGQINGSSSLIIIWHTFTSATFRCEFRIRAYRRWGWWWWWHISHKSESSSNTQIQFSIMKWMINILQTNCYFHKVQIIEKTSDNFQSEMIDTIISICTPHLKQRFHHIEGTSVNMETLAAVDFLNFFRRSFLRQFKIYWVKCHVKLKKGHNVQLYKNYNSVIIIHYYCFYCLLLLLSLW